MLPRPNRKKKQHRILKQGDIEVIQAEVFGYNGSFEAPGGGGGYQGIFKQHIKDRGHWDWHCKDFEKGLKEFGEEIGVRNTSVGNRRSLHQGTNHDK